LKLGQDGGEPSKKKPPLVSALVSALVYSAEVSALVYSAEVSALVYSALVSALVYSAEVSALVTSNSALEIRSELDRWLFNCFN
jgi:hypothetical protein